MKALLVALVLLAPTGINAQAPVFKRGQTVRVRPSLAAEPVPTLLLTIVAGPGDRLQGIDARLFINDVSGTGMRQPHLRGRNSYCASTAAWS